MSPRPPQTEHRPTVAELAILDVLWEEGPSTVRKVHEILHPDHKNSYTTTLKLMQIMHAKGLVTRDEEQRAHVYCPALSRDEAQDLFVGDLVHRLFRGSATRLALRALGHAPGVDDRELAEIRRLIRDFERDGKTR